MREAFAKEITALASELADVTLLSGDIGNRMFDRFNLAAPERFFNCGIAEANMMSLAAGMALSGLRPVIYTITPFTTTQRVVVLVVGLPFNFVDVFHAREDRVPHLQALHRLRRRRGDGGLEVVTSRQHLLR